MGTVEENVADYYERIWSVFTKWWKAEKTLGLHYALYDKNAKNFESAILNMNDFVGKLLKLDEEKPLKILDAGCGIGGTSIYLAEKYPYIKFTGITITPPQKELAIKFARERNISNVSFMIKNYLETDFPDNHFDGIFALESTSYASSKKKFVQEMYRILKPGGRLVVVDAFFKTHPQNPIMQGIHDLTCLGRGMPLDEDLIVDEFIDYLKERFEGVEVINISRKVWRSQARSFIIGIPFFISSIAKSLMYKDYEIEKDTDFYIGTSVLCGLYGLTGKGGYYAMTAVK
jgi:cyclopropane fatty-acyl-phospholipid synthase-like methyltransferase